MIYHAMCIYTSSHLRIHKCFSIFSIAEETKIESGEEGWRVKKYDVLPELPEKKD
jgi:hypothetical protein